MKDKFNREKVILFIDEIIEHFGDFNSESVLTEGEAHLLEMAKQLARDIKYRIKTEWVYKQKMFDVYVFSEGVWELVDSFQCVEDANEYIERQI